MLVFGNAHLYIIYSARFLFSLFITVGILLSYDDVFSIWREVEVNLLSPTRDHCNKSEVAHAQLKHRICISCNWNTTFSTLFYRLLRCRFLGYPPDTPNENFHFAD